MITAHSKEKQILPYVLVLAGGGGTRLWPLSRQQWPKQFLAINAHLPGESLLTSTIQRMMPSDETTAAMLKTFIITNAELALPLSDHLAQCNLAELIPNIISEPCRRNTAPAIALAALRMLETSQAQEEDVLVILPADHFIESKETFQAILNQGAQLAKEGYIVTLGVPPTRPDTGYGYIECSESWQQKPWLTVKQFVEKPTLEKAEHYLSSGQFLWNAGIFVLTFGTMRHAFKQYASDIHQHLQNGYAEAYASFDKMPDISFDFAIMEHAERIAVVPTHGLSWSDVGTWDSLYEVSSKDSFKNVVSHPEKTDLINSENCLVRNESGRFISMVNMDDCLVVDTPDALLITQRGKAQHVKDVVSRINATDQARSLVHRVSVESKKWGTKVCLHRDVEEPLFSHPEANELSVYKLAFNAHEPVQVSVVEKTTWIVLSGEGFFHSVNVQALETVAVPLDGETRPQKVSKGDVFQQLPEVRGLFVTENMPLHLMAVGPKPVVSSGDMQKSTFNEKLLMQNAFTDKFYTDLTATTGALR